MTDSATRGRSACKERSGRRRCGRGRGRTDGGSALLCGGGRRRPGDRRRRRRRDAEPCRDRRPAGGRIRTVRRAPGRRPALGARRRRPRGPRGCTPAVDPDQFPETFRYRLKNKLLGPPLVTEQLSSERLSRPIALGVLAPDCISSSAYGTEEMLTQLVPYVGLAAFALVVPITIAILGVLFFVTLSYLEVIQLYTKAGGSYVVARDNFGPKVAQVAAVALLIDYTVTVAVQTAAGTAALTSAVPVPEPVDHRPDHRGGRPAPPLRQPAGHPGGRQVLRLPDLLLHRQPGRSSSSSATSRRPSAISMPSRCRRPTHCSAATSGRPGSGLLMGLAFIIAAALVRQRRLLPHRAGGHLQRGQQLPQARVAQRPDHPGDDELGAGVPGAGRHAARQLDPRRALRRRLPDGGLPGGQVGASAAPVSATSSSTWSSWPRS